MKNTLTALAFLVAIPTIGNAAVCGTTCPAPAPTCAPCPAQVCTQPACVVTYCCPVIRGFANGGNPFPGAYVRTGCSPCCN